MWLEEDRSTAIMWLVEQRIKCPSCGTRLDEWEENRDAYYAEAIRCLGCEKIAWEGKAWEDSPGSLHGLRVRLTHEKPKSNEKLRGG